MNNWTHTKINSTGIKIIDMRPETFKLQGDKIEALCLWLAAI